MIAGINVGAARRTNVTEECLGFGRYVLSCGKVLIIPDSLMAEHIALDDDMYVRLVLGEPFAPLSEWLGTALQKLVHWFKSSMVLHGSVAQWLEQSPHKTLVGGSNPFGPNYIFGTVAQLVERRPEEASVGSSSLSRSTIMASSSMAEQSVVTR